ncbi:ThiF family adenylyltransferase [bacterium]|nr:ThiF family adenylyltransferase [bacterium]
MDPFLRQLDLVTPENLQHLDVDIVGAGSLGGACLLTLGKMGFGIRNRITVTDFDRCEPHNVPTQWFRPADASLSRPKVDALGELAAWVLDREVETVDARFTGAEERRLGPIVILAVDSLGERAAIWNHLKRRDDVRLLVDARAGAEVVEIRTLDLGLDSREARNAYEASLAGEPFEEPCTRRSIAYTTLGAASFVGSIIRSWVHGDETPRSVVFDFRNFWVERSEPAGEPAGP